MTMNFTAPLDSTHVESQMAVEAIRSMAAPIRQAIAAWEPAPVPPAPTRTAPAPDPVYLDEVERVRPWFRS